eukprot:COSAG03_NODE_8445_length_802_cov_1.293030_1_plen_27_part_10
MVPDAEHTRPSILVMYQRKFEVLVPAR